VAKPKDSGPKAYAQTKVHYAVTQGEIVALLEKYGIEGVRWTNKTGEVILEFIKEFEVDGDKKPVGVRLMVPNLNARNRNQLHRALFYYLKSKFESLEFEFIEFVQEFLPYLLTDDGAGKLVTVYEKIAPAYIGYLTTGESQGLRLLPEGF
jgi:hypothetical protein